MSVSFKTLNYLQFNNIPILRFRLFYLYFAAYGGNQTEASNFCQSLETYQTCGTACQPSCDDPNPVCTKQCVPGCFCNPGLLRVRTGANDGPCVPQSQCLSVVQFGNQTTVHLSPGNLTKLTGKVRYAKTFTRLHIISRSKLIGTKLWGTSFVWF